MKYYYTAIKDLIIFEPNTLNDKRGQFYESYVQKYFNKIVGREINFVQENFSISKLGVLRGMHYQKKPYEQGKLVSVVNGKILDVALDLRKDSDTYGNYVMEELSSDNKKQLWIPEGFAHGFLALTDNASVKYKTTSYYSSDHDVTIKYNDPQFSIDWPKNIDYIISEKDS